MKKPKKKRLVGITFKFAGDGIIHFYANDTVAMCAGEFGQVRDAGMPNKWRMVVDGRYDFDDVVEWLESFN